METMMQQVTPKQVSAFMAGRKRSRQHISRTFPRFNPGMSTAEYVRQYWGANARNIGIECGYKDDYRQAARAIRDFFGPLNHMPAAILEGPDVIAEVLQ